MVEANHRGDEDLLNRHHVQYLHVDRGLWNWREQCNHYWGSSIVDNDQCWFNRSDLNAYPLLAKAEFSFLLSQYKICLRRLIYLLITQLHQESFLQRPITDVPIQNFKCNISASHTQKLQAMMYKSHNFSCPKAKHCCYCYNTQLYNCWLYISSCFYFNCFSNIIHYFYG